MKFWMADGSGCFIIDGLGKHRLANVTSNVGDCVILPPVSLASAQYLGKWMPRSECTTVKVLSPSPSNSVELEDLVEAPKPYQQLLVGR